MGEHTALWIFVFLLVVVIVGSLYLLQGRSIGQAASNTIPESSSCANGYRQQCVTPQGFIGYHLCLNNAYTNQCYIGTLDDCKLTPSMTSAFCCKAPGQNVSDCTGRTTFPAGEYLLIKWNLQRIVQTRLPTMQTYVACIDTTLDQSNTYDPSHYTEAATTGGTWTCSKTLSTADYHIGAVQGRIASGDSNPATLYIFPAGTSVPDKATLDKLEPSALLTVPWAVRAT